VSDDRPTVEGPPRRGGPGQGHHADRGQREAAALRGNRALELRAAGAPYEQIAQTLGYSNRATAARAVQRALDRDYERTANLRDEYRQLHLMRTDRALRAIWPKVIHGDLGAIDRLVRLLDRQAKLLGLDAPTQISVTATDQTALLAMLDDIERLQSAEGTDRDAALAARDAEIARLEALLGLPGPNGDDPPAV
jgi:hypothetical protein